MQNVRRERLFGVLRVISSFAAMLVGPVAFGAAGLGSYAFWGFLAAVAAFLWSASSLAAAGRGPGERRFEASTIAFEAGDLVITTGSKRVAIPLSFVSGGWVEKCRREPVPTPQGTTTRDVEPADAETAELDHVAVLTLKDGHVIALKRSSEDEAFAFLRDAGAGVSARAVRMHGYREDAQGRRIAGCFTAIFGILATGVGMGFVISLLGLLMGGSREAASAFVAMLVGGVPIWGLFLWMLRKVQAQWIEIGADGIVLPGALRRRFFSHADIVKVDLKLKLGVGVNRWVEIHLKSGKKLRFPVGSGAEAIAVRDRIEAARAAVASGEAPRLLDVLARAGRPIAEWRQGLARVLVGSGYRAVGHDLEGVMRIVEDAKAPLSARIAAAIAALPSGGDEAKARIRIAAEACVEPRVRVALTRTSEGALDDAELEAIAEETETDAEAAG